MSQRTFYSEEARRQVQRQQLILAMAVASVSLSLGAIIALLFAPQSGDAIRHEIRDQLNELLERSTDRSKQTAHNIRESADKVRSEVQERIDSVKS